MEVQSKSVEDFDDNELEQSIRETSAYFSKMLNLIPPKVYMPVNANVDCSGQNPKYMKNKRGKAPKQELKDSTKRAKGLKGKSIEQKSIDELQKERDLEEKKEQEEFLEGSRAARSNEDQDSMISPIQVSRVKSTSLDDLKERLQNKIVQLQLKRRPVNPVPAKAATKKKPKENKKSELKKAAGEKLARKRAAEKPSKPSVTDEQGRVVFSKFDFISPDEPPVPKKKKKDLQTLLAKAEWEKKRLESMTASDRAKKEESLLWSKALNKVKGEKQRDDPDLLKKSIKRRDNIKKKSQKEWNSRVEQVEQQKAKRQEVRSKNLKERSDRKKEKKIGKRRKPGF